ncbi:hypothetical protein [Spirochaeta lutea]|uniref:Alkylmercury lyase n=1 Tax=Spirochaeta lutea TaxID=1480694 RepID=A0A098R3Q2_9SPIO|nr:hypothetical protein [Spirochaeta lutea]KGE73317.1 hypothetical protein DC28_04575 [Spirochaeta lutea]
MILFQYFCGCPNSSITLANLQSVMRKQHIPDDNLDIVEISSIEQAEREKFSGSPTILIDNIDIYTLEKPVSFSFACRVYNIQGQNTGVLPESFIESRMDEIQQRLREVT